MFKRIFKKQSVREKGTLVYFKEKLQRRNVTLDVKHYEDCEQFFLSVGKCYVTEALIEFFKIENTSQKPNSNFPVHAHLSTEEQKVEYFEIIDKFLNEYVFLTLERSTEDGILSYAVNLMISYMILADFKDAVSSGNGEYLATLHKQLLLHFSSASGFNAYAIEMLISILQNEVLLSQAEAHQNKLASTVNWKGGMGKNVEIDLFQENRNKDIKSLIKSMGANKTDKAISRASKASGGVRHIVDAFDKQVGRHLQSSSHSHRSSAEDEKQILADLRALRPFQYTAGRLHKSFNGIQPDALINLKEEKFEKWLSRHKKNIVMHFPCQEDEDCDDGND